MYGSTAAMPHASKSTQLLSKKSSLLRELSDDEGDSAESPLSNRVPWLEEFSRYYDAKENIPDGMSIVQWWGVHHHFIHSDYSISFYLHVW